MQNGGRLLRDLAGVEISKRAASVGVHHGLQIDPADPLERSHIEGVLSQQFPGFAALDMPLLEARIQLFDEGDLLSRQLHPFLQVLLFQLQLPLILRSQPVLVQDALDRRPAHIAPFHLQPVRDLHASPPGVLQCRVQDLLYHLRRGGLRVDEMNGGKILQAGDPLGLEPPFPLVESRAIHLHAFARLGDVAQGFGQLQHSKAPVGQLLGGVFHGHFRFAHCTLLVVN